MVEDQGGRGTPTYAEVVGKTEIWTVGHSTHEVSALVDLLRQHGIEVVADVRSYPSSRHNPQFNRKPLRSSLLAAQIEYVFLGQELSGQAAGT